jgi:hypothetical protein
MKEEVEEITTKAAEILITEAEVAEFKEDGIKIINFGIFCLLHEFNL